jgi:uncharacterized protein (DUF1501 family)
VDSAGWDLHANAGDGVAGRMREKLVELGRALAAFADELGDDLDRVTVVTMTEFGRRVAENGSGGTDHGLGTACLVLGGAVRGGRVLGRWPGLGADQLVDGDLAGTTDYRSILAELLASSFGLRSTAEVFPGFTPEPVDLIRPA